MKPYPSFSTLITADRENRANFKTLLSCVMPRPIAFVSTLSKEGVANLAPFSFFNAVGSNPPAVVFSPATKADGSDKDTLINLQAVPEFVVHVVSFGIKEGMNEASYPFPPETSEFEQAGFTKLKSKLVQPFRAAESPVHLECKLHDIVKVGQGPLSANICIGEVLCFHVATEMLLDDETVDVAQIDLLGRLGGEDYCTIRDRLAIPKPARR